MKLIANWSLMIPIMARSCQEIHQQNCMGTLETQSDSKALVTSRDSNFLQQWFKDSRFLEICSACSITACTRGISICCMSSGMIWYLENLENRGRLRGAWCKFTNSGILFWLNLENTWLGYGRGLLELWVLFQEASMENFSHQTEDTKIIFENI